MSRYEVPEPIINSPYDEPSQHWRLEEGKPPELASGRRPPVYYYRPTRRVLGRSAHGRGRHGDRIETPHGKEEGLTMFSVGIKELKVQLTRYVIRAVIGGLRPWPKNKRLIHA